MNHEEYMKLAFELAEKGTGFTKTNPLVGAILVKNGLIIGKGYHEFFGGPHAEVNAILNAKQNGHEVSGATLYCNLEPCSHLDKKTPPCAQMLVKEKINTLVVSNRDPNPKVNGKGFEILRQNNITVIENVLSEQGEILNEVFFHSIKRQMPFVHLKMAQSLDGKIATEMGNSKYISCQDSLERVHEFRQKYEAILIGSKTLALDNSKLTVRSSKYLKPSHPKKIIIGSLKNISLELDIFKQASENSIIILTTDCEVPSLFLEKKIKVITVPKLLNLEIDLKIALQILYKEGIHSILVEGGPIVASSFLRQKLVQKVSFFIAPIFLGGNKNSLGDLNIDLLEDKIKLKNKKIELIGDDILVEGYLCLQE